LHGRIGKHDEQIAVIIEAIRQTHGATTTQDRSDRIYRKRTGCEVWTLNAASIFWLVVNAATTEKQERATRAVAMSLALRRAYFDNLDRWVFEDKMY